MKAKVVINQGLSKALASVLESMLSPNSPALQQVWFLTTLGQGIIIQKMRQNSSMWEATLSSCVLTQGSRAPAYFHEFLYHPKLFRDIGQRHVKANYDGEITFVDVFGFSFGSSKHESSFHEPDGNPDEYLRSDWALLNNCPVKKTEALKESLTAIL